MINASDGARYVVTTIEPDDISKGGDNSGWVQNQSILSGTERR